LDDQFLYNLACWVGLDFNLRHQAAKPDPDTEAKALRYLAYCLTRAVTDKQANGRANDALNDSDLQLIPEDKIRRLLDALAIERQNDPQLWANTGSSFVAAIDRALAHVG
jgi:hypothetical protein